MITNLMMGRPFRRPASPNWRHVSCSRMCSEEVEMISLSLGSWSNYKHSPYCLYVQFPEFRHSSVDLLFSSFHQESPPRQILAYIKSNWFLNSFYLAFKGLFPFFHSYWGKIKIEILFLSFFTVRPQIYSMRNIFQPYDSDIKRPYHHKNFRVL